MSEKKGLRAPYLLDSRNARSNTLPIVYFLLLVATADFLSRHNAAEFVMLAGFATGLHQWREHRETVQRSAS